MSNTTALFHLGIVHCSIEDTNRLVSISERTFRAKSLPQFEKPNPWCTRIPNRQTQNSLAQTVALSDYNCDSATIPVPAFLNDSNSHCFLNLMRLRALENINAMGSRASAIHCQSFVCRLRCYFALSHFLRGRRSSTANLPLVFH